MSPQISVSEYELPDDDGLGMAGCVTVLADDAIRRAWETLVVDGVALGTMPIAAGYSAPGVQGERSLVVQSWRATSNWWVLVENNGYWGSLPENLLKTGSQRAASVFWNVNSLMSYVEVERGKLIRRFDPLFRHPDPEDLSVAGDLGEGEPFAVEDALPFFEFPLASALRLLASRFEVDVREATLQRARETWVTTA